MINEDCIRALKSFAVAFSRYLVTNGRRTYEIASITGQRDVKVALRALYRVHDSSYGFVRIHDVIDELIKCNLTSKLRRLGVSIELDREDYCLIIDLKNLRELVFMREDDLRRLIEAILSDESHAL